MYVTTAQQTLEEKALWTDTNPGCNTVRQSRLSSAERSELLLSYTA